MFLSEKTAPGALTAAWKAGYHVFPDGEMLHIYTKCWAAIVRTDSIPLKLTLALVEQVGHLPITPEEIRKGRENQEIMQGTEQFEREMMHDARAAELLGLRRLPIIFRDRWQLYAVGDGQIVGYDQDVVKILSDDVEPSCCMATGTRYGLFLCGAEALIAAPAKFSAEDEEKLRTIGGLYRTPEPVCQAVPENVCMFELIGEGDEC